MESKDAKSRVAEAESMPFRERERAEAILFKAMVKAKVQAKSGSGAKDREEFR